MVSLQSGGIDYFISSKYGSPVVFVLFPISSYGGLLLLNNYVVYNSRVVLLLLDIDVDSVELDYFVSLITLPSLTGKTFFLYGPSFSPYFW